MNEFTHDDAVAEHQEPVGYNMVEDKTGAVIDGAANVTLSPMKGLKVTPYDLHRDHD